MQFRERESSFEAKNCMSEEKLQRKRKIFTFEQLFNNECKKGRGREERKIAKVMEESEKVFV